ncbi:MAG TPA: glycosyltransferase [Hyphomicrobiaceae bacterium]|nr:glycosyltransferase [Hyphomicrobiaceae bacterium]
MDADPQYRFLIGAHLDVATLAEASRAAIEAGTMTHEIILASGWVGEQAYVDTLAAALGLERFETGVPGPSDRRLGDRVALVERDGAALLVVDAMARGPEQLARELDMSGWPPTRTALATRNEFDRLIATMNRKPWMAAAVEGLHEAQPHLSALHGPAAWQIAAGAMTFTIMAAGLFVAREATFALASVVVMAGFLSVAGLRLAALGQSWGQSKRHAAEPRLHEADLPVYSLLVPLFREGAMVRELVGRLASLDYPSVKLDILLILEESDEETIAAIGAIELPSSMRVVLVPKGGPQTKPKALNFALHLARGAYIVVYDAEDFPERDQLRRAVWAFKSGDAELACVQACLNVYNPRASWLTRQFTLEYTAQFDAIFPALVSLGLPVPLGGTSNHFPADVLRRLGAWDPYNVTEDADLGLRIARAGLRVEMLASTTWEEAPETFGPWLRQRTRWLKGWFTTWLVHMRRPRSLLRDLGLRRFLGWQLLMAGIALSVLTHGLFSAVLLFEVVFGGLRDGQTTWLGQVLGWAATVTMIVGLASAMVLGAVSARRRGRSYLARSLIWTPLYWIAISLAAYRALWQLFRSPHHWEKTPHGIARHRDIPHRPPPGEAANRGPPA